MLSYCNVGYCNVHALILGKLLGSPYLRYNLMIGLCSGVVLRAFLKICFSMGRKDKDRKKTSPSAASSSGYNKSVNAKTSDKHDVDEDPRAMEEVDVAPSPNKESNYARSPVTQSAHFTDEKGSEFPEETLKLIADWMDQVAKMGIRGIREEFVKEKRTIVPPSSCEAFAENEARNRYDDVLLLDSTRVKLQNKEDDYIHASHVNISEGYSFICAQSPMSNTSGYFYRMLIENQCNVCVMLCDFREKMFVKDKERPEEESQKRDKTKSKTRSTTGSRTTTTRSKEHEEEDGRYIKVEKSYDYVPLQEGDFLVFGALTVRNRKTKNVGGIRGVHELEKIVQRELEITDVRTKKVITITHLHYTAWPDHRVPSTPFTCLEICRIARSAAKGKPVLVHCSAGIGRTGTMALIEMSLQRLTKPDKSQATFRMVDALNDIRMQRMHTVQGDQQYVFAHRCVVEQLVEYGALTKSGRVQHFITEHENFHKRKTAEILKQQKGAVP